MDAKVHASERPGNTGGEELLKCAFEVDTRSASPAEQFDLFRSWHERVADAELLQERIHSFPAHEKAWDLGTLIAVTLELPGSGYRYRWRHLKKATIDNWCLFLPLSRSRNPGGNPAAGKPVLESYAEPFEYVTEDDAFFAFFMPHNLPFLQSPRVEIREEAKGLLADYMLLLHRSIPDLRVADIPHVVTATTSLFAACLSLSHDRFVEAQHAIDSVIVERASKIIGQKLNDPNLTPDKLCRELGVSRSRLYRIFEPVGGVSNYIRRKRLLKTRDILADSSDGRPISTVAEDWGFTDPSTYSRMFRKEFGITPKEARVEGWRGVQLVTPQQISQPDDRIKTLSDLLLRNCFGP